MLVQPLFVTAAYAWGRAHPAFGGAMGGVIGMGMAAYAGELVAFLLGLALYRRLGYAPGLLFMAHFDKRILKRGLRFGVFEMLGSVAWALGQAAEIAITQGRLLNYAEIWGNWMMAQNFIFAFNVLQTLFESAMPAISEAISSGKRELARYYSAMMYKYGGMMSAFMGAALLAVADRFILGSTGVEFERAAALVLPLAIWGAIQYPSWVGDQVQLGSGKPYLKSILVAGEQVVRIVLALALLSRLQVNALIIAYFVGLAAKGLAAYAVNDRSCFKQGFYAWQSLAAPLLAGTVHYLLLRWLTGIVWQGDPVTSILIFFIAILPSFPLFAFLYGLFGGWDEEGLAELREATDLTGILRPLTAALLLRPTSLGSRISPLAGRFPILARGPAMGEAELLSRERVSL
jgi:O-antigen/teichoic acid export membrane protein